MIITWNPQTNRLPAINQSDDRVNIICFDESKNEVFVKYSAARRGDGEVIIDINKILKQEGTSQAINVEDLHFWVYLSSKYGEEKSESWYLGV